MADKAIRKISLKRIKQVESHAQMLYNIVKDNRALAPKNDLHLAKNLAFQEAICAVVMELIEAIKGEQ